MIRIDLSEYQERHNVARLIGAPPGYIGFEEGGQLTEAVRRHPYAVILFDEIEKAHSDVFNVMLQILDDGRLTDGQGRVVDFKNTIVLMTSNLGSQHVLDTGNQDAVRAELRRHFRPEFLNRVDEIIIFHALTQQQLRQIVDIQLRGLAERLADRHITLEMTDGARDYLVEVGYEPSYGARPLKRAIQREIETPLARLILEGRVGDHQRVTIDRNPMAGGLSFLPASVEYPAASGASK